MKAPPPALTSDRESWGWQSDLAAQILLHRTSGSCFSEVKRRILCCWDIRTVVMGKASGRLLPVFCDGLPQLAQDPTSVSTVSMDVSHRGLHADVENKPCYLSLKLFRSSLVTSLRISFKVYSSFSI